ncbi:Y-family DNA polymerase [Limimaricola sp.]|uniref:Y-family DNA polymerase n=1 Tax=Limimaricola sp. TaxID=2211665 RepID=UPI004059C68C
MFGGITRRVVSMWYPRLASDRVLRARPVEAPFALTLKTDNTERIHCLNARAEAAGLRRGMRFAEARGFCVDLQSAPARPDLDARFLTALRRWATRYAPWVGLEGRDGLVLDVTGAAHLWGGEAEMLDDMRTRLDRAGLSVRIGLGDTRGAAWALAHHGEGIAPPGAPLDLIGPLPIAALRLDDDTVTRLQRLGLRCVRDLAETARAPLARRFGPGLLLRLDQALGDQPEAIEPEPDPPSYAVSLSLPDPIGLTGDVMAGVERLLDRLCDRLAAQEAGARALQLSLRRVDRGAEQVTLRLARAMRDPSRILPLFARGVAGVDAGFGIDRMRLEAVQVEPLPVQQLGTATAGRDTARLDDLITRIGARIGIENVQRFVPVDSHIPERSFRRVPATGSVPCSGGWSGHPPRPLRLFSPEPIPGTGPRPPDRLRWRRMTLDVARAIGPERIAPEWWHEDEAWRSGLRDYWRIETRQGRRLWLFYTPQQPGWFVHGEFA